MKIERLGMVVPKFQTLLLKSAVMNMTDVIQMVVVIWIK